MTRASNVILDITNDTILSYFTAVHINFVTRYEMRYIVHAYWCNHITYVNPLVEMNSQTVTNDDVILYLFLITNEIRK